MNLIVVTFQIKETRFLVFYSNLFKERQGYASSGRVFPMAMNFKVYCGLEARSLDTENAALTSNNKLRLHLLINFPFLL